MITCTSVSGGQSSAYIAANYPSDYLIFALVTIEDRACTPKDKKLVQLVSDKIGREFIATAEDDVILHTIMDLEQYLGQRIEWLAGKPFEKLRKSSLPNINWRHCTELLKIKPMYDWWKKEIGEPVEMKIGFRAGEERRAKNMLDKCDEKGLRAYNKKPWQKPVFPMINDSIHRDKVVKYWEGKPVRFADLNNCVGCFHRNPILLRKMWDLHPNKMDWFKDMEAMKGARWKSEVSYNQIKKHKLQQEISFNDFNDCDSGACGL
jgi:hypothetical protein